MKYPYYAKGQEIWYVQEYEDKDWKILETDVDSPFAEHVAELLNAFSICNPLDNPVVYMKHLREVERLLAGVCYYYTMEEKSKEDWNEYHKLFDELVKYGVKYWKHEWEMKRRFKKCQ